MIPLGWFTDKEMTEYIGKDWPSERCTTWHNEDIRTPPWMGDMWPCPCELNQALADFGRFQPDAYCNMFQPALYACHLHEGATHCVRSVTATYVHDSNICNVISELLTISVCVILLSSITYT